MKFEFTTLGDKFPAKKRRSNRLEKKLHVGKFSETFVTVSVNCSQLSNDSFDKIVDVLYETNDGYETFYAGSGILELCFIVPTNDYSTEHVSQYCYKTFNALSTVYEQFNNIDLVSVTTCDAYYGEFE